MPSRRTLLRTVSVAAGGAFAGCSSFEPGVDGYVQLKSIEAREGNNAFESLLRVTLRSPPGSSQPELTHYHDEWVDRFDRPHEPVVSDALHDELTRVFDTVKYVIGICSPSWASSGESVGCHNDSTSLADFNSAQVHDHVSASINGTTLTIHSVDGSWTFEAE